MRIPDTGRLDRRFWTPVVIGVVLTPLIWWFSVSAMAAGHGTFAPFTVAFPYAVLVGSLWEHWMIELVLVFGQFPLYGILVGGIWRGLTPRLLGAVALVLHVGAVWTSFALGLAEY